MRWGLGSKLETSGACVVCTVDSTEGFQRSHCLPLVLVPTLPQPFLLQLLSSDSPSFSRVFLAPWLDTLPAILQ